MLVRRVDNSPNFNAKLKLYNSNLTSLQKNHLNDVVRGIGKKSDTYSVDLAGYKSYLVDGLHAPDVKKTIEVKYKKNGKVGKTLLSRDLTDKKTNDFKLLLNYFNSLRGMNKKR